MWYVVTFNSFETVCSLQDDGTLWYSRASCLVDPLGNAASGRPGHSGCYVYWGGGVGGGGGGGGVGCQHKEWQLYRFPLVEEDWV